MTASSSALGSRILIDLQPQRVQLEEVSLTPSNAQRASAVPVAQVRRSLCLWLPRCSHEDRQPQTISYEPAPAVDYMAAPQRAQRVGAYTLPPLRSLCDPIRL